MQRKFILAVILFLASTGVAFAQFTAAALTATAQATQAETAAARAMETPGKKITHKRAPASPYVGFGMVLLNVRGFAGLMPKVFVGYGSLLGRCKIFYLGAEAFAGGGTYPFSHNQHHRVNGLAGLTILPGYMWTESTLLFARLGAEAAYFSKIRKTRLGPMVGLGFETYASEHWDLRGEYDYNPRKDLNQYSLDLVYKFC